MKILLFSLLFSFLYVSSIAQVSGYQGKKFILKTDLIDIALNEGYALSLEAAIGRHLGLTVAFAKRSQEFKNLNSASDFEGKDEEKAVVLTRHLGVGMRFYRNRVFTAPKGAYTYLNLCLGVSDMDVAYNVVENGQVEGIIEVQLEEYIFSNIELGIGKQNILANRIILDIGLGFNSSDFLVEEGGLNSNYSEPLASRQGQNLGGFKIFKYYMAFSGHLSIGLLLF